EFLSPEGWQALDRLGLAGMLAGSGYHIIHRVRLSTPRGRVVDAEFTGPGGLPGIGLSRSVLDALIVRHARAAGAEAFDATRVGGPIVQGARVVGLTARHATEGPIEIRAEITVAADGRHSGPVHRTGTTRVRSWLRP